MFYKNKLLLAATILGLTFSTGCFGGSSGDGADSLHAQNNSSTIDLSGSYTTTDLSNDTKAVIGNFSAITLRQSGTTLEGTDNLGNAYSGTISLTNNENASGSNFTIHSNTASGITITLTATYDPEEIDYVPGSVTVTKGPLYTNPAGTTFYQDVTTTTIDAKTTSYKTWIGQMVLSNGPSSTLTIRGDIVVTGGSVSTDIETVDLSA